MSKSSDIIELEPDSIERIKTTRAIEVIQIPVQQTTASEENSAATTLDETAAEDDRTLEQVADISVDVFPSKDQQSFTPRASLDDVLEIPIEYAEPPTPRRSMDQQVINIPITEIPTYISEQTMASSASIAETTGGSTLGGEKSSLIHVPIMEMAPEPETKEDYMVPIRDMIEVPIELEQPTPPPTSIKTETVSSSVFELPTAAPAPQQPPLPEPEEVPIAVEQLLQKKSFVEPTSTAVEAEISEVQVEKFEKPPPSVVETEEIRHKVFEPEISEPSLRDQISRRASDELTTARPSVKKKTRQEIEEEVRTELSTQPSLFDQHQRQPAASAIAAVKKPSHVTYASWAPPGIHAPAYEPYSCTAVAPETKYRNKYTVNYTYTPPAMTRLHEFDDYVKIGPYGQGLWSTERALQRSRSLERRSPPGLRQRSLFGLSPITGRRAFLGAAYSSAPLTRSSSASSLLDYVSATRYDLKRTASDVGYVSRRTSPAFVVSSSTTTTSSASIDDEGYYTPSKLLHSGSTSSSELLSDDPYEKFSLQTENYLQRLHRPYESTAPSYYGRYVGRSYNPFPTTVPRYDISFYDSSYRRRLRDDFVQPSVKLSYEGRLSEHVSDLYRDREARSRIQRDRTYSDFSFLRPPSYDFVSGPVRSPRLPYYSTYNYNGRFGTIPPRYYHHY